MRWRLARQSVRLNSTSVNYFYAHPFMMYFTCNSCCGCVSLINKENITICYNTTFYYIVLSHIVLYCIVLYHNIISYHIIYHIISYIISYHTIYHISYHIKSHIKSHIISYLIIPYHIISYHIMLHYVISYHIILSYMLHYTKLHYIIITQVLLPNRSYTGSGASR